MDARRSRTASQTNGHNGRNGRQTGRCATLQIEQLISCCHILAACETKALPTIDAIADELEMSDKTVRARLQLLRDIGISVRLSPEGLFKTLKRTAHKKPTGRQFRQTRNNGSNRSRKP